MTNKTYQPHDKMFRQLLSDKTQVVGLLDQCFHFGKAVTEDKIERYNGKFVNSQFKIRETDILYKLKDTSVFFLIEHQSRIDYNMLQRIAEYQFEIMKIENPTTTNSKNTTIPLIISLVIYTNNHTCWNAHQNISDAQPFFENYSKRGLGSYDVLDINKFKIEDLLRNKLFTFRLLCLEKARSTDELTNIFYYLLSTETDENHLTFLKDLAHYVYKDVLNCDDIFQCLINVTKEGGNDMSFVDMVIKEKNDLITLGRKTGRQEGRKEGVESVAIEMLKQKVDDNYIITMTKLDASTLARIKKKHKFLK